MVALALVGCAGDDGENDTGADDDDGTGADDDGTGADDDGTGADSTGGGCVAGDPLSPPTEGECPPLATDFVPGADDDYPACVADNGEWTVVIEDPPGSADRSVAYDDILALLRSGSTPTADDFTMARARYAVGEGLESRIVRREDLHFPPIAMEDQDPGVDFDKQCGVTGNPEKYPDRCVGPAKIAPIVDAAFAGGMTGEGDADVHAARIDAAIAWFLMVSTYKESESCIQLPEDCDAHRGYFQGAQPRDMPIGLGAQIQAISPLAYEMVYDGMLAVRCWRDLYPGDDDPTWEELMTDGQDMYIAAHEQLDNALWYAWARFVRAHIEEQPAVCGAEADASWAYLQIVGAVLDPEAERRDASMAGTLSSLWQSATPPETDQLQAAADAIDALFPCPQCDDCNVEGYSY